MKMKCLTLIQPYATLVALLAKQNETRGWATSYRGPLGIHAAKTMPQEYMDIAGYDPIRATLKAAGYTTRTQLKNYSTWGGEKWLPSGVIVAVCELVAVRAISPQRYFYQVNPPSSPRLAAGLYLPPDEPELSFGDYTPGRYAWILDNIRPLETPIPATGNRMLWDWEGELPA